MTVSELILKIDDILNLGLSSQLDTSIQSVNSAMESNSCCKTLLNCCNFVTEELASSYAYDVRHTVAEAADNVINLGGLRLCRVISLVDSCGNSVPFKHTQEGLLVDKDGKYNLTYVRLPKSLTFDSVIEPPNALITERIITYGVIAEYLRITGDYAQSASWAGKLNQALSAAAVNKTYARLPSRRWLI